MILDRLASKLGVRGDEPNRDLAREISAGSDAVAVDELVAGLSGKDKAVRSDCIKTLYEIGYLKPELIAGHACAFLKLLPSRDNRLVWGAMIALSTASRLDPDTVLGRIEDVFAAMREGSVITVDNGVKTLAAVAAARPGQSAEIFAYLINHLRTYRASQVPQHAESTFIAVNAANRDEFLAALRFREPDMTPAQMKRIQKLYRQLNQLTL